MLDEAKAILELCAEEEEDFAGAMPDSIRQSAKGERADECAEQLREACDNIEHTLDTIDEATR